LFTGKAGRPPRESIVFYVNNELFGAKWRNWKMLLKDIDGDTQAVRTLNYPSIYNLIIDPKEQDPLRTATFNTWSAVPLAQVIADHQASLAADPGSPAP
jgi:arylsulfatase